MKKTKNKIFEKIIIAVIIFVSFFPLLTFGQSIVPENVSGVVIPDTGQGNPQTITQIVTNFMRWILGIFGMLAVIAFVIAGILYITSAGNQEQAQKAKRAMVYSIVGVVVGLMGVVVIKAVEGFISGRFAF